jgi:hypothetical protein
METSGIAVLGTHSVLRSVDDVEVRIESKSTRSVGELTVRARPQALCRHRSSSLRIGIKEDGLRAILTLHPDLVDCNIVSKNGNGRQIKHLPAVMTIMTAMIIPLIRPMVDILPVSASLRRKKSPTMHNSRT